MSFFIFLRYFQKSSFFRFQEIYLLSNRIKMTFTMSLNYLIINTYYYYIFFNDKVKEKLLLYT
jgi:hypothetical protein